MFKNMSFYTKKTKPLWSTLKMLDNQPTHCCENNIGNDSSIYPAFAIQIEPQDDPVVGYGKFLFIEVFQLMKK